MGKMKIREFKKSTKWYSTLLELLVSDLSGPLQTRSLGRSNYIITLIDVYSSMFKIDTIPYKESTTVMKSLKKMLGDFKLGNSYKTRISGRDIGLEYEVEVEKYLRERRIKHQKTVRNCPQSNAIAERFNLSLLDKLQTVLLKTKLPHYLWAELAHVIVEASKAMPTSGNGKKISNFFFLRNRQNSN
jgi:hypothetical protein